MYVIDDRLKLEQPLMVPIGPVEYELVEEYTYYWMDAKGRINRIVVPKGTKTDGASVPQFAWSISGIRPDGLIRAAALIHDWIYNNRGNLPDGSHTIWNGGVDQFFDAYYQREQKHLVQMAYGHMWIDDGRPFSHRQADKLFAHMMTEAKMKPARVTAAYVSVRLFGWWV